MIWKSDDCRRAIKLLDYKMGKYTFPAIDGAVIVNWDELHRAMRTLETVDEQLELSELETAIRDETMDKLFIELEKIYAHLHVRLIAWPDIVALLRYPLGLLRQDVHVTAMSNYAKQYEFFGTYALITDSGRYPLVV